MALDPSISLNVRPPVIPVPDIQTPLERFAKVLSLRNLMTQGESGQIGLQTQQLQLEQAKREAQERQDLARFLAQTRGAASQPLTPAPEAAAPTIPPVQPTPPGGTVAQTAPATIAPNFGLPTAPAPAGPVSNLMTPPSAAASGPTIGGISYGDFLTRFPTIGPGMLKTHLELEKAQTETDIKHNDAQKQKWEAMAGAAQAVQNSKNPEAEFTTQLMDLYNAGHINAQELAALRAHGYDPGKMQGWKDRAVAQTDFHNNLKTDAETQAKDRTNFAVAMRNVNDQTAYDRIFPGLPPWLQKELGPTFSPQLKAGTSTWDVPGQDIPKTQLAQIQTDSVKLAAAMKDGPKATAEAFANLSPDSQRVFAGAKTWQEVVQRGLTPEQTTTAAQAQATAAETKAQHAQTNKNEQARIDLERQRNAREENIYQNTYGPNSNEALVGVDPKLRKDVTTKAQKYFDEYNKAVESTGNMQTIIDLARSGNKVAYAYAPTTGVMTINTAQGVKRVNMPEIKSYGGAGSAADRIEGWLGKNLTGESIPKEILANMEQVNKSISENASAAYDRNLDSLNQNYHSNFKRAVKSNAPAPAPAAAPPKVGEVVSGKGGQKYMFIGGDPKDKNNYKPWTPVAQ